MAVLPALLLSLALLPQEAPVATTQPEPAPVEAVTPTSSETSAPAEQAEGAVPRGAPSDDYGLVNWCWGALAGHMSLYPRVRDQLPADGYDLDEQQMAAGREYLTLYERAVAAADASSSTSRAESGRNARNAGQAVWAPAAGLAPTDLKWAYLGWSLPGRCETASRRLLSNAELMAPALRPSVAAAGAGTAPAAPPQAEATTADAAALTTDPIDPGAAEPVDPTASPVDSSPAPVEPAPAEAAAPPR